MNRSYLSYLFLRALTAPFALLPYWVIHRIGSFLGLVLYFLYPKYRKRALSNLSLASALSLTEEQVRSLAKESLQNLLITALEYSKLSYEKEIHQIATCENPEEAASILNEGKGVIFFCGHQANWEVLFLEGTRRMPGVAIGRPIKNRYLYQWILKIRQKYGGKIITPKNAAREGLKALKKGSFLGIVGDQGMPNSGYSSLFLGRLAWTSPLPAILAHRTGSALIVAVTRRENDRYKIHYSRPLWPHPEETLQDATARLMGQALHLLEKSIIERPGEWLWVHNRWKQQSRDTFKPPFRHDSLLLILPEDKPLFDEIYAHLSLFRTLYPTEVIALLLPQKYKDLPLPFPAEKLLYQTKEDLYLRDLRFKLIFNFTPHHSLKRHFLRRSTFTVATLSDLQKLAGSSSHFPEMITKAIMR